MRTKILFPQFASKGFVTVRNIQALAVDTTAEVATVEVAAGKGLMRNLLWDRGSR